MGLLDWAYFHLWHPQSAVVGAISAWEPSACTSEKDYERSLSQFIADKLPSVPLVNQYGVGRARVDIVLGAFNKVAVELKRNYSTTAQHQRLVGQLESYRKEFSYLVLVLCGEHDPDLVSTLMEHVEGLELEASVLVK